MSHWSGVRCRSQSQAWEPPVDVFEDEPNVPEALRASPKVVLTPHIASATVETRTRMADLVLENLDAFIAGARLPSS